MKCSRLIGTKPWYSALSARPRNSLLEVAAQVVEQLPPLPVGDLDARLAQTRLACAQPVALEALDLEAESLHRLLWQPQPQPYPTVSGRAAAMPCAGERGCAQVQLSCGAGKAHLDAEEDVRIAHGQWLDW